jgi:acyl-CoA thioester hydrolase
MPEHELQIRIRYHDTDPMGFLHHANYLVYYEMGRTELLRSAGGNYREMEESGLLIVVAKAECRYYQPARYDDVVTVRTTLSKVTHAKIIHDYEMRRNGERLASATITLAMIDRGGRIQRIPDWMRD